jgi:hypothetical protein
MARSYTSVLPLLIAEIVFSFATRKGYIVQWHSCSYVRPNQDQPESYIREQGSRLQLHLEVNGGGAQPPQTPARRACRPRPWRRLRQLRRARVSQAQSGFVGHAAGEGSSRRRRLGDWSLLAAAALDAVAGVG